MVKTFGLTHVALAVRDPARSARFYQRVVGAAIVYRSPDFVQLQTPGARDVLVLERSPRLAGKPGGVVHFGYRLRDPRDITSAAAAVRRAGGIIVEQGEFVPGEPFVFARDPDGYTVELWYELPTPIDPGRRRDRGRPRTTTRARAGAR